jgi:hypothetical protein
MGAMTKPHSRTAKSGEKPRLLRTIPEEPPPGRVGFRRRADWLVRRR